MVQHIRWSTNKGNTHFFAGGAPGVGAPSVFKGKRGLEVAARWGVASNLCEVAGVRGVASCSRAVRSNMGLSDDGGVADSAGIDGQPMGRPYLGCGHTLLHGVVQPVGRPYRLVASAGVYS